MAGTKEKKTCYYELLGLDRKCDAAEIKSTYRKLALKMHPDKAHMNGVTVEEATKSFQQIQEAYSVLSDPQERAWYDAHREQILKGHDDGEAAEDPFKTRINLYKYFSSSCFNGFGDGSEGFFSVYGDLFAAIDAEEAEWEDLDSDEDHAAMPPFGRSDTDPADVASFYRNWLDFCSRKAFHHADKWNPKEAPNRQVRRAMEMENKKARQAAKKDFNAEVRQLVKFVQKRDPRVKAQQKQQMKESVEKKQREQTEKEQRKAEEALTKKERQEAARLEEEARWAEYQAVREARRARGEVVSEDEDSESEKEEVEFVCEACRKSFKSEKAYDQHAKSKKHLQVVAALRRELERDLQEEAKAAEREAAASAAMEEGGEPSSDREDEMDGAAPVGGGSSSQAGQAKDGSKKEEKEDDRSASEDEEDEEGDFLARFAARRGPGGFAPPSRAAGGGGGAAARGGGGGGSSSSSSSSAAAEEAGEEEEREQAASGSPGSSSRRRPAASEEARRRPAATSEAAAAAAEEGAGRRAQKRAQQRAVLLERQRERDGVEDLVNGCRKAQRAAKRGEANEAPTDAAAEAATNGHDGRTTVGSAPTAAGPAESARCAVCGENFLSRTKLFQHIKASGHAALKPTAPQDASGKTKNKKR